MLELQNQSGKNYSGKAQAEIHRWACLARVLTLIGMSYESKRDAHL